MTPRLRPLIRAALILGQRRPPGIPRRRWARELRRLCDRCGGVGRIGFYPRRDCPDCDGDGFGGGR